MKDTVPHQPNLERAGPSGLVTPACVSGWEGRKPRMCPRVVFEKLQKLLSDACRLNELSTVKTTRVESTRGRVRRVLSQKASMLGADRTVRIGRASQGVSVVEGVLVRRSRGLS